MRRSVLFVMALAPWLAGGLAVAQGNASHYQYRWTDDHGQIHFSDSLSSDAVKYGYDVINGSGMLVTHVSRQLSPSERAAAEKQAAAEAARQHAIEEHRRNDVQMLNTYPDEAALKSHQQQVLETIDGQINTTRLNLHGQDAALTDLLGRAAENERAKQPVPKFLTDQIAAQRNVVANERALLQRQQSSRDAAVQQQAQELQHYRDLKTAQQANGGY